MRILIILSFLLLFFVDHIYSQGGIKNENKLDSFSIYKSNASFLKVINEEFKKLKKKSLDTVLLFYKDAESTYKYSVVWERKKNIYY